MFKKILIPTDGSELSAKAIQGAIDYAQHAGATLIALTIIEPYPFMPLGEAPLLVMTSLNEYAERSAQENIAAFERLVAGSGVQYQTLIVNHPSPSNAIVESAKQHACDAIFMASHGRKGIGALVLGSETHKVLTHSALPVLVFR